MKLLARCFIAAAALTAMSGLAQAATAGHMLRSATPTAPADQDQDITGSINKHSAAGHDATGSIKKHRAADPAVTGSIKQKSKSSQ